MDRLSNFLNTPSVRFGIITIVLFVLFRLILALVNSKLQLGSFLPTALALLAAGFLAYKVIYR